MFDIGPPCLHHQQIPASQCNLPQRQLQVSSAQKSFVFKPVRAAFSITLNLTFSAMAYIAVIVSFISPMVDACRLIACAIGTV